MRRTRREPGTGIEAALRSSSIEKLAATDVDGLRPYQRGTPASRISWPALARGAGLLERRLRADPDTSPLVVLDARCSGPEEQVDAAVRAAASLTLALARAGGCDLLLPGDRRPVRIESNLSAWTGMHVRLALVEGGPDAPAPWLSFRSRVGRVFFVAAEADGLPAALSRGDHRAGVLVLPLGLTPSVRHEISFEVSGCRGYLLGQAAERRARERAA